MPRGKPNPTRINRKLCYGPSHESPSWQPFWNFNRVKGKIWYECKNCHAHRRRVFTGYSRVSYEKVEFAITELIHRLGKSEASRRIGISKQQISKYAHDPPRSVRRETADKILNALQEARSLQEVRHRDSIHNGAYLRGIPEKQLPRRRISTSEEGTVSTEIARSGAGSSTE